jgi:imidazolonepropionase-like amidohydrolase
LNKKTKQMKKSFVIFSIVLLAMNSHGQETIYPAKAQSKKIIITGGTVHVGNGKVLENNGAIVLENGKITAVGGTVADNNATVVNAAGKHIYPGLILATSNLGLQEITGSVRGTNDVFEIGELNPNVRSIVAYNTDSRIINTVRSNGILLANVVPRGNLIGGSSSTVQLDAWTWEDAAYHTDYGMHFYMPSLFSRPNPFAALFGIQAPPDPLKRGLEQIEGVKQFFREAKAYFAQQPKPATNLKLEAVKGLFNKKQRLFIHCNIVKEMLLAVDFVKEFGFDVTLVGAEECWQVADLLKQHNISVVLQQTHNLPTSDDDDVDQPFKTPAMLQKAGVLFALTDEDGQTRGRNLPFNAGTAVAYGLGKEEALQAITLNAASILGIAGRTGSIEPGKDANLVISEGDILDMRSSIITHAFIQGRAIDLNDKHKQLNERYVKKYGL